MNRYKFLHIEEDPPVSLTKYKTTFEIAVIEPLLRIDWIRVRRNKKPNGHLDIFYDIKKWDERNKRCTLNSSNELYLGTMVLDLVCENEFWTVISANGNPRFLDQVEAIEFLCNRNKKIIIERCQ